MFIPDDTGSIDVSVILFCALLELETADATRLGQFVTTLAVFCALIELETGVAATLFNSEFF